MQLLQSGVPPPPKSCYNGGQQNREGEHYRTMAGTIIAVTNQKGGVGKTTTAVNLAYYAAKAGKQVLLVDFDPQGNATSGLGIDKRRLQYTVIDALEQKVPLQQCIVETSQKRLHLLPTTPQLANAEVELAKAQHKFTRLKTALASHTYDLVIIDCPPSLSLLTVNALIAANHLLLPVQAEFYALEGLGQLLETMQLVRKGLNPQLDLLGVVLTMVDSRTTLSTQVQAEVKKHFADKVFATIIPRNIRLAEAPSHGLPVGAYDRWSKGARAYKSLAKEVLGHV
jgi:chromosome partitioning protein